MQNTVEWGRSSSVDSVPAPVSAWHVAVGGLGAIACCRETLLQLFGNHYGAMLSAGAADADGEIAFAFVDVVRQKEGEHLGDLFKELAGLRELADVLCDLGMLAGELAELWDEVWVGKEAHVEDEVGVGG